jgi:molybdate transport system ATP-binding protein
MKDIRLRLELSNLDVDLDLPGHGVTAIVGPSGAGKTTLLRAVAGLERASRGHVVVKNQVWQDDKSAIFLPAHMRAVGFVFQEASLFPHLTVQKNVEFGLRRVMADEQKISLDKAIELLGLESLLSRLPSTLSGGEQQRVAIARALATSPGLLLMDEPLASLDTQRKQEILPYLDQLHREFAIPILYVTHAMDEVAGLADQVVLLEAGKVSANGSVFDVMSRPDLPIARGDQASALFEATISSHDPHYQLTQVAFAGGKLWLPMLTEIPGAVVRIRIQARDVSLAIRSQTDTSILNSLPVLLTAILDDAAGQQLLELNASGTRLLARITRKSADQLGLVKGMSLFAQIKGVAVQK